MQITAIDQRTTEQIDASLKACGLLALEALLTLISGLLLFLLACIRVLSGIITFSLALLSFTLWCLSVWGKATESTLSLIQQKGSYSHDK